MLISRIYVACVSGQRFNGDGGHILEHVVMCLESEQYYLLSNLSTTTGQLSQKPGTYVKLRADADPGVACKIMLCQFMAIQF